MMKVTKSVRSADDGGEKEPDPEGSSDRDADADRPVVQVSCLSKIPPII